MAQGKGSTRTRGPAVVLAAMAIGAFAAPASATVYEIGPDGAVNIQRSGPAATYASDSTELAATPTGDLAPDVPPAAITTLADPVVPPDYRQPLLAASRAYGVSPRLLAALAARESAWRAAAVSPKGAIGLTQLMPATARSLAVDPREPSANLAGGAHYLRQLIDRFGGNLEQALAAYNAGPGRVTRAAGVPAIPETRAYVTTIVDRLGSAVLREERQ